MKSTRYILSGLLATALVTGCATVTGSTAPEKPAAGEKTPHAEVKAEFLTAAELRAMARAEDKYPGLNERLKAVWPQVAYTPGQSQPQSAILVAAAGWVTKEIVNYIGSYLEAEAAKHSAQFGASVANPDWWDPTGSEPLFTAVRLSRELPEDNSPTPYFDLIVLVKPLRGSALGGSHAAPGFQLIPVYMRETKPQAELFGKELGSSVAIHLANTWVSKDGDPTDRVAVDYTFAIDRYTIGTPFLFADASGAATATSPYFALPEHAATITAKISFTETDPSRLVSLLQKLGSAISGQADNASTAVKAKMTP